MLKIVMDAKPMVTDDDVRHNIDEMRRKHSGNPYTFVPGGTLALMPGWCESCNNERAWVAWGGGSFCHRCRNRFVSDNGHAGFARVLDET